VRADKLYLVGFMGAGKTTVARALGARLGWRVEDIDTLIESI
jgi:shikimate kinase